MNQNNLTLFLIQGTLRAALRGTRGASLRGSSKPSEFLGFPGHPDLICMDCVFFGMYSFLE